MFIKGFPALHMTPMERLKGRFMRAPDHPNEGLDNGPDEEDDDDQSGDADEDNGSNDDIDENADNDDEGSRQDAKPKRGLKNGYQRRIDRLTQEVADLKANQRVGGGQTAEAPKKPVVTDFDTYEEYTEALIDFKAEQIAEKKLSERDQRNSQRSAESDFNKSFSQGKRAYSDWDDVVTEDAAQVTQPMVRAIKDSDNPADVTYYLASNPDEADRIADLPAGKQANAIAKIDARFDGKKKVAGTKTGLREITTAPEPITPTKGSGGAITKDPEKMSADEWIRFQNSRKRQARG